MTFGGAEELGGLKCVNCIDCIVQRLQGLGRGKQALVLRREILYMPSVTTSGAGFQKNCSDSTDTL